jgi:hypothetical protein
MVRSSRTWLLLLALVLAACDPQTVQYVACPYIRHYNRNTLNQALREFQALPPGSALRRMMGDYETLRTQVRLCQGNRR